MTERERERETNLTSKLSPSRTATEWRDYNKKVYFHPFAA